MSPKETNITVSKKSPVFWVFALLVVIGLATFLHGVFSQHPEKAWQAYLINFLLWSGIAQGAVLFSAVMHITKARWSGPLASLSEAFTAFFPLSFILFLLLFLGRTHIFPWMHEDLHGKEIWLNIPFLFWRDFFGLLILYLLGFVYLYHALQLKFDPNQPMGKIRNYVYDGWKQNGRKLEHIKGKMSIYAGLYILAFALVLSLIGFDLVMSMDPHWFSTLFGAYHFVKAFYIGLGALIILASILHLRNGKTSTLTESHFHDIGKLFFAFCLLWADFFYVQLTVIWYGNIPEESHYVILRTMLQPWKSLAWTVFILSFVIPFVILISKKVKTKPVLMIILCTVVIVGMWLEHLLLLGPALNHHAETIPFSFADVLISLGFLGLLVISVYLFVQTFPETMTSGTIRQEAV